MSSDRSKRTGPGNDEPIQETHLAQMNAIAKAIDDTLNGDDCPVEDKRTGFILLVFPFGEANNGNRMNCVSNGDRADVLLAMREIIARNEGRYQETETKQ